MTEPNPNPDAPQDDAAPGEPQEAVEPANDEPRQDATPAAPVDAAPAGDTNVVQDTNVGDSEVVPNHAGVPVDDSAEPEDADVEHEATADEVENQ